MADGLGLQGPWGLASLQASIRQRQLDRMAQQQKEFENAIQMRSANRADAEQLIRQQEHAAALAEKLAAMEQAGRAETAKFYGPGDRIPPGTNLPSTPEMTLPSTQMGRGMPTPPGLSSSLDMSAPDTATPSPMVGTLRAAQAPDVMTSTPSRPEPTGWGIYPGTEADRTGAEQKALRAKLLANPNISPRERAAIELETAGLKVPAGMFESPGAITDANYTLKGKPIVAVRQKGRLMYQGQDVTDQVTPYVAPKDNTTALANEYDRSYQYHRSALDKLSKPIEDQQQKLGELSDLVNQGTPQADALVAPKLLSTTAGGQGSGLRMNEAEISRIIGGRSKWQNLKASLQQWSLDPTKANSITPEQRQQITSIMDAMHEKSQKLLSTVNDAGDHLITAPDVGAHRRVLASTKKQMQQINDAAFTTSTTKPTAADLIKKYGGG